jgi:hypothetical protein
MGFGYVQIINNFLAKQGSVSSADKINVDDIDMFLETITDVYVNMLERGVPAIEVAEIKFKSDAVKMFFAAAFIGIQEAMVPDKIELILDFLLLQMRQEHTFSSTELFEIYLLTKIIPLLSFDAVSITKYIDLISEFCSGKIQHFLLSKFTKFIDLYKINDCYELNYIKEINEKCKKEEYKG